MRRGIQSVLCEWSRGAVTNPTARILLRHPTARLLRVWAAGDVPLGRRKVDQPFGTEVGRRFPGSTSEREPLTISQPSGSANLGCGRKYRFAVSTSCV
jgi:hypothetical protein